MIKRKEIWLEKNNKLNIQHKEILDKIHLLTFDSQLEITSTLLRFQEYYESPKFKDKIFTLQQFKQRYIQTSPNGVLSWNFTYYTDRNGFNIPSYVLKPFYNKQFDPLSDQEKQILDIFKNQKNLFYIIGIHKNIKTHKELLRHEIAHWLFYTNKDYREEIIEALCKYDIENIKKELRLSAWYHEDVLEDEIHAYIIDSWNDLKNPIPEKLWYDLNHIFKKYIQKNWLHASLKI